MRLSKLVSSKTDASAKCIEKPSAPVFERLEPRMLLSADLSLGATLDPLPSAQDEPAVYVALQAESTLLVTNTNDAGEGSLRAAIENANKTQDLDTIFFAIGEGGAQTILLASPLPVVSQPLVIDGASQPGITLDATAVGTGTVLTITASGCTVQGLTIANAPGTAIQLVNANGCTLSNLDVSWTGSTRSGAGVGLGYSSNNILQNVRAMNREYGFALTYFSNGNIVRQCDASGSSHGVYFDIQANGNTIERNTIVGCDTGIFLVRSQNNTIYKNILSGCGTGISSPYEASGTSIVENNLSNSRDWAIVLFDDSAFRIAGNLFDGSGNGLRFGRMDGVSLGPDNVDLSRIEGVPLRLEGVKNSTVAGLDLSWSGSDRSGTGVILEGAASNNRLKNLSVRNRQCGFSLSYFANSNVIVSCDASDTGCGVAFDIAANGNTIEQNTIVGSDTAISIRRSDGNVIRYNNISFGRSAVVVEWSGTGNRIYGNSIHSNSGLGIDLGGNGITPNDLGDGDTGPNNYQNFPVLAVALGGYTTRIQGSLNSVPNTTFTLDLYANSEPDPSGYGEGQRYLGSATVTTGDGGDGTFDIELAARTRSGEFVTATATDPDGNASEFSLAILVPNVPPTLDDATFEVEENSPNGTAVGTVVGSDADGDTLRYSIVPGSGVTAFAIEEATGQITVADEAQLDYETNPSFTLEIEVKDEHDATAQARMTINLLNQASVTGVVFVDVDRDGVYEANEPGIDGVTIQLQNQDGTLVLDGGSPVTAITSSGGFYLFEDLRPGVYRLHEVQPTGVDDGAEILGSLGGTIPGNDTMQLALDHTDAEHYIFAEIGQKVTSGDTATIGFWQNKNGQELIRRGGTALANWLTANFGNVFGNVFVGGNGDTVARFFKDQLFLQKAEKSAGPAKVDAQYMAVALAAYFTSRNLAGAVASQYGFRVTDTGIGTKIVNVGSRGAAFGVANGTPLTIMQLLLATNALTDQPHKVDGYAYIYDKDGNGIIEGSEVDLRRLANEVYAEINESGER